MARPPDNNLFNSAIVHFGPSEVSVHDQRGLVVEFETVERYSLGDPEPPVVSISCFDITGSGDIRCTIRVNIFDFSNIYHLPIANLGATRIFGESEEGETVELFRMGYD